jgi:hypothetical protein
MPKELTLEITTPVKAVEQMIKEELSRVFNGLFLKNSKRVELGFRSAVKLWILEQPEMQSVLTGGENSLAALFGITPTEAPAAIDAIAQAVSDSMVVKIQRFDKNLKGEVLFYFQPSSLSNLLSLNEGYVTTLKKQKLHWLDWLLTQGDSVIVVGYTYEPSSKGRSGAGTMKTGGAFRVPPQFSGNLNNNFVTRAFQNREKSIASILEGLLQ